MFAKEFRFAVYARFLENPVITASLKSAVSTFKFVHSSMWAPHLLLHSGFVMLTVRLKTRDVKLCAFNGGLLCIEPTKCLLFTACPEPHDPPIATLGHSALLRCFLLYAAALM